MAAPPTEVEKKAIIQTFNEELAKAIPKSGAKAFTFVAAVLGRIAGQHKDSDAAMIKHLGTLPRGVPAKVKAALAKTHAIYPPTVGKDNKDDNDDTDDTTDGQAALKIALGSGANDGKKGATTTKPALNMDKAKRETETSQFQRAEELKGHLKQVCESQRTLPMDRPTAELVLEVRHGSKSRFPSGNQHANELRRLLEDLTEAVATRHGSVAKYVFTMAQDIVSGAQANSPPTYFTPKEEAALGRFKAAFKVVGSVADNALDNADYRPEDVNWSICRTKVARTIYGHFNSSLRTVDELMADDTGVLATMALTSDSYATKAPKTEDIDGVLSTVDMNSKELAAYQRFFYASLLEKKSQQEKQPPRSTEKKTKGAANPPKQQPQQPPKPAAKELPERRQRQDAGASDTPMHCKWCHESSDPWRVQRANTHNTADCSRAAGDIARAKAAAMVKDEKK
jgi:hypothetical protein